VWRKITVGVDKKQWKKKISNDVNITKYTIQKKTDSV